MTSPKTEKELWSRYQQAWSHEESIDPEFRRKARWIALQWAHAFLRESR